MCNCYSHKCDHENCNVLIHMHLEDFETEPREVEVFCGSHIPPKSERLDGVLWSVKHDKSNSRIFVRSLTKNAKRHWRGNCYNGDCKSIEVFGRSKKRGK